MSEEIYYDEERNIIPMPLDEWNKQKERLKEDSRETTVIDCNGNTLSAWDAIIAIKDLNVKWWEKIKRGDKFTNVSLTDDPTHVRAKHKKHGTIFLKTEFFKKW